METVAESVRAACLKTLLAAYEDAGVRGLCAEGRWEVAVAAVRDMDLGPVIAGARESDRASAHG